MNKYETIITKINRKVDTYIRNLLLERKINLTDIEVSYYSKYPHMFVYDTVPFISKFSVETNGMSARVIYDELSLDYLEKHMDLELNEEERKILKERGFNASAIKVNNHFKDFTSDDFLFLNQKTFYLMNYHGGIILGEVENQLGELILNLWYKLSENYGQISHIVGFQVADNSQETIKKEIVKLIDNGYIDDAIEMLNHEALENGWL